MTLANGAEAWSLSPAKYVQEAIRNCQVYVKENLPAQYILPKRAENPFPSNYELEMDVTLPLGPSQATYFQSIIGVMRWMVELGAYLATMPLYESISSEQTLLWSILTLSNTKRQSCKLGHHTLHQLSSTRPYYLTSVSYKITTTRGGLNFFSMVVYFQRLSR